MQKPGYGPGFQQALACGESQSSQSRLLDFGFLVHNVLTDHRIVFLEFEFIRGVPLVFISGVEVTGTGTGHQLDLIAHGLTLPKVLSKKLT
jgi:hypothetical protein